MKRSIFVILISIAFLVYILVRAYSLSLVHDESLSFTILQGSKVWINTPNNHLLNTVLMGFCKSVFGDSEFSLRLPNVLSFLLYLLACLQILKDSKNNWFFLFGMTLLLFNPFELEFFSLARGYGLSLGLMMMSVKYLVKKDFDYSYKQLLKDFILSLLFALLATYANLTMVNFFISVAFLFGIKFLMVRKNHGNNWRFNVIFLCIAFAFGIPVLFLVKHLLLLRASGQLYVGAFSFSEAIDSLITSSLYIKGLSGWVAPLIRVTVILFLILGLVVMVIRKIKNWKTYTLAGLNVIITILLISQHFLFHAYYPVERTALFYLPIVALNSYYLFQDLTESFSAQPKYYIPVLFFLTIPVFWNFFSAVNFTSTKTWYYDAHTKDVMRLIKEKIENSKRQATISNHWLFEPSINYYISIWGLNLRKTNRDGVSFTTDFVYQLEDAEKNQDFTLLQQYEDCNCSLLVNDKFQNGEKR